MNESSIIPNIINAWINRLGGARQLNGSTVPDGTLEDIWLAIVKRGPKEDDTNRSVGEALAKGPSLGEP